MNSKNTQSGRWWILVSVVAGFIACAAERKPTSESEPDDSARGGGGQNSVEPEVESPPPEGGAGGASSPLTSLEGPYRESAYWRGYSWARASLGASLEGSSAEGVEARFVEEDGVVRGAVLYGFNLNQSRTGEAESARMTGPGVYARGSFDGYSLGNDPPEVGRWTLQLLNLDSRTSWCAPLPYHHFIDDAEDNTDVGEYSPGGFERWETFVRCEEGAPSEVEFDPAVDEVTALAVEVVCSDEFPCEGAPEVGLVAYPSAVPSPNHHTQPWFRGNSFIDGGWTWSSYLQHDYFPLVFWGGPDIGETVIFGFYLNQASRNGPIETYTPRSEALFVRDSSSHQRVDVLIGDGTTTWCQPRQKGQRAFFWSEFRTECRTEAGESYEGQPLTWVGFSLTSEIGYDGKYVVHEFSDDYFEIPK